MLFNTHPGKGKPEMAKQPAEPSELDKAKARIATLENALRPFAAQVAAFDHHEKAEQEIAKDSGVSREAAGHDHNLGVPLQHLRAAAAALKGDAA